MTALPCRESFVPAHTHIQIYNIYDEADNDDDGSGGGGKSELCVCVSSEATDQYPDTVGRYIIYHGICIHTHLPGKPYYPRHVQTRVTAPGHDTPG